MPFDVIEILRREDEREQDLERKFKAQPVVIPVVLCNAQGEYEGADGLPLSAQVEGDPVRVWARTFGESPPGQFLNIRGVPAYTGIPAYAGYLDDSKEMEILSVNVEEYTELVRELKERHALQHQPGGFDPLDVLLSMIVPLRVTAQSGLTVQIAPLAYETGGAYVWFPGQNNFDLTASIPGAGLARYTLVYLDPADNTIKVINGDTVPDTLSIVPDQPAPLADTYPAGWVRLANGQTQINQVSDVKEARLLFSPFSGTSSGGVWPKFDEIKVLFSDGTVTSYTTMALAVAALTGGEVILVGPGTFTCNFEQIQLAKAALGSGMGVTELLTTTANGVLWINGPSSRVYLENLTLRNTRATGANKSVLTITNGSAILRNVEILNQLTNAGDNIGLEVLGSGGAKTIRLLHCIISATSGAANYSVQNNDAANTVYVEGGSTEGDIAGIVRSQLQRHVSGTIDVNVKGTSLDANAQPVFGMAAPTTGQSIYWDGSKWIYYTPVLSSGDVQNIAINGNFQSWPELTTITAATTPANSDKIYFADQWVYLAEAADVADISRENLNGDGGQYYAKFLVATANNQFAAMQPLSSAKSLPLRNQTVSLFLQGFTASGAEINNIRAAVLRWAGTADAMTDPIATWAGSGTNPTLATNWSYASTPSNLDLVANDWTVYKVENVALGTSFNNLAILIWIDDEDAAVNDILGLATVGLFVGETAPDSYPYEDVGQIIKDCSFYAEMFGGEALNEYQSMGLCISTTQAVADFRFSTKRAIPTVTVNAASNFSVSGPTGTRITLTALTFAHTTTRVTALVATVAAGLTAGNATIFLMDNNTNGRIFVNARLGIS